MNYNSKDSKIFRLKELCSCMTMLCIYSCTYPVSDLDVKHLCDILLLSVDLQL